MERTFVRSLTGVLRLFGGLLLVLALGACRDLSDPARPEALPYQFETVRTTNHRFVPADLNGDGTDEKLVRRDLFGNTSFHSKPKALQIETQAGKVIEQVNYAYPIGRPHPVDVTGDGTLEIAVPFVRHDSLFLSLVSADGAKRKTFYVTEGEPRQEPESILPWDPKVKDVFWTDTDGNGTRELLTVVQTRYARLPRGVWIHKLPSGRLVGKKVVGATLDQRILGNFDQDPAQELLVAAGASKNGAEASGMSDRHAYHYAFDLGRPPTIQWKREVGGPFIRAQIRRGDLNGDAEREYVAFTRSLRGRVKPARFQILDPGTGEVRHQKTHSFSIENVALSDLDGDGAEELLVLDASGILHQLGRSLIEERRADLGREATKLRSLPDVTSEGQAEVLFDRNGRTYVVVEDLSLKARISEVGQWTRVRRGPGKQPYLQRKEREKAVLYRLVPNPYWWLYRWGPWALGLLGIGLVLGGGYGAWRGYRRYREVQAISDGVRQAVDDRLFLAHENGALEPLNDPARQLLRQDESASPEGDDADGRVPLSERLAEWTAALESQPLRIHEAELDDPGDDASVHARAHPLSVPSVPGTGTPAWLLRVEHPDNRGPEGRSRTWRLMARRVAHDLRNPLTGIRLALQSMQMTYREAAPDAAAELDAYTQKIEGRIEALRRTATNVMKLVGAEETNSLETDLTSFIRRESKDVEVDLPENVELHRDLTEDLPPVSVDREQMASVLENLVHNAVEALPEGGTITVQTWLARDLWFSSDPSPRDYVVAEVMDTGVGMDAAAQAHAFEPGFTTEEQGTGLGLTLVKRIVSEHEGHVEIDSDPEVGTAVRVYLPVTRES